MAAAFGPCSTSNKPAPHQHLLLVHLGHPFSQVLDSSMNQPVAALGKVHSIHIKLALLQSFGRGKLELRP